VNATARHLPRVLRLFDLSVLASASMGPAYSLAATMGPMVAAAGSTTPYALFALSAIMLCIAVAFAQLSEVAPNAGSSYSWIRMAFGNFAGAYGAWLLLLSNFFATLATAVPAGIYTLDLFSPRLAQDPRADAVVGAIWIIVSSVLLYVGIRPTAIVTAVALALEFVILGAAAIASFFVHPGTVHNVAASTPLPNVGIIGFLTAMTLGIWMSDGWEVSASASEEVADNREASGRGGIVGLLMTTAVLMFCMIAFLHAGSVGGFIANQADALRYVADVLGGGAWRFAIVLTVLVSTSSALWTTVLYLSRSTYAMGRDGVLPRALGRLDARSEPLIALATVAILTTICELLTGFSATASDALTTVVDASAVFLGLLFVLTGAAAVKQFWSKGMRVVGIPMVGTVALLGILAATVLWAEPSQRLYALGGVGLGIPLAIWRAAAIKAAGTPPGGSEPTALAS